MNLDKIGDKRAKKEETTTNKPIIITKPCKGLEILIILKIFFTTNLLYSINQQFVVNEKVI